MPAFSIDLMISERSGRSRRRKTVELGALSPRSCERGYGTIVSLIEEPCITSRRLP